MLAGAVVGWAGVACAEPVFENGKLLPLADGFPDRPITLVNVDDPGTRDGIYARSLQEALRDISPVEVLVSDEPAPSFGTFYAVQDIQDRGAATTATTRSSSPSPGRAPTSSSSRSPRRPA